MQVAQGADAMGAAGCALGGWRPRQESGNYQPSAQQRAGNIQVILLFSYLLIALVLNYFSYLDLSDTVGKNLGSRQ